jgi:hypothetical protein
MGVEIIEDDVQQFQGRGGAFRREAHCDVFRSMTRCT